MLTILPRARRRPRERADDRRAGPSRDRARAPGAGRSPRRCCSRPAPWSRLAVCARRSQRDWPSERPPRPLEAATGHVPAVRDADAGQRPAGGGRPAPRAAGRQPAPARARRLRRRIRRTSRASPTLVATLLDQGTTTQERRARSPTRSTSSAAGSAPAPAPTSSFVNADRDEGQLRRRARPAVRRRARSPAFSAEEIERQREQAAVGAAGERRGSRLRRRRGVRSPDLRVPSRTACPANGTPESVAAHHARRPRGLPRSAGSRRTTPSSRSSATSASTRPSPAAERVVRHLGRAATCRPSTVGRAARRRRGASSSSTGPTPCRPRSASGSSPSRATTRLHCRSTWP